MVYFVAYGCRNKTTDRKPGISFHRMQAVLKRDKQLVQAVSEYFNFVLSDQGKRFYSKIERAERNKIHAQTYTFSRLLDWSRNNPGVGHCEVAVRQIVLPCNPRYRHSIFGRPWVRNGRRHLVTSGSQKVQTTDREKTTSNDQSKSPYGPGLADKGSSLFAGGNVRNENKQISQLILKINEELLSQVTNKLTAPAQQSNFSQIMSQRHELSKTPSDKYLKYFTSSNSDKDNEKASLVKPPAPPKLALNSTKEVVNPVNAPVTDSAKILEENSQGLNPAPPKLSSASADTLKIGHSDVKVALSLPHLNNGEVVPSVKTTNKGGDPLGKYSINLSRNPVLFSSKELLFNNREKASTVNNKTVNPGVDVDKLLTKLSSVGSPIKEEASFRAQVTAAPSRKSPADEELSSNTHLVAPQKADKATASQLSKSNSSEPEVIKPAEKYSVAPVSESETSRPPIKQGSVVIRKRVPDAKRWQTVIKNVRLPNEPEAPTISTPSSANNEEKISNIITAVKEGKLIKFKGQASLQVKSKQTNVRKRLQPSYLTLPATSKAVGNPKTKFVAEIIEPSKSLRGCRSSHQSLSSRKPKNALSRLVLVTQKVSRKKKLPLISLQKNLKENITSAIRSAPTLRSSQFNKGSIQSNEFQATGPNDIKQRGLFQASHKPMTIPPVTLQGTNRNASIPPPFECKIETSLVCIPSCKPPFSSIITTPAPRTTAPKRDPLEFLKEEPSKESLEESEITNCKSSVNACSVVIKNNEGNTKSYLYNCRPKLKPKFPPNCPPKLEKCEETHELPEESSKKAAVGYLHWMNELNEQLFEAFGRFLRKIDLSKYRKSLLKTIASLRKFPSDASRVPDKPPRCCKPKSSTAKLFSRKAAKSKIYGCASSTKKKVHVLRKVKSRALNDEKKKEIVKELSARRSNPKANPSLSYSDVLHIIFGKKT